MFLVRMRECFNVILSALPVMSGIVEQSGGSETQYRRLPKRSLKAMYVSNGIAAIIIVVLLVLLLHYRDEITDGFGGFLIPVEIILVAAIIYLFVSPSVYYRYYRYSIDDDKLDVLSGVVFRTHDLVPVERIHQVNVTRGPIDRAFGLADVTVTTAGGTFTMKHLDDPEAEAIAAKLNDIIVRLLKARDR